MYRYVILFMMILGVGIATQAQDSGSQEKGDFESKGIYNITDFGIQAGSSRNSQDAPFTFMNVVSYHLDPKFAVGIGVGADFYEETYIPIVADIRYYLRTSKFTPFAYLQIGHSIAAEGTISQPVYDYTYSIWPRPNIDDVEPKGGFLINPGIGVKNMFSEHFGIIFSVGYRYQKLSYEVNPLNKVNTEYNRLNIKFGIIFR